MFTIATLQDLQIDLSGFDKVEVKILTHLTKDSATGGDWVENVNYKLNLQRTILVSL